MSIHHCLLCLGSNERYTERLEAARRALTSLFPDVTFGKEMLTEAARKAADLEVDQPPFFLHQSMPRLRLAEPVDAVVSTLDSLMITSVSPPPIPKSPDANPATIPIRISPMKNSIGNINIYLKY